MAEAGINVVRLAEFAWVRMEPRDGCFDFDWLDHAISILAGHDIRIILGTPTASPPAWLMTENPDMFIVRHDGRRATYGNRREYCPNNPRYHEYSRRIVTEMARHYAGHPSVIGWQIDNEFTDRCYCPICAGAFQEWLRQRYGSLDELNARWGTVFWSHVYTDWGQVPLPLETGGSPNPGLALDFCRFASDSYVAYQQLQIDVLRELCPDHFITHNFMGFSFDRLDCFDLARALDFVSWDNYVRWNDLTSQTVSTAIGPDLTPNPSTAALGHDAMRGLKRQNFWVMEAHAGPAGWESIGGTPRPGEMRLWAYQGIAHGADGILFFRWRTCRFGTEEYWHGVLDHHARPGRRYEELGQIGGELKRIGAQILGTSLDPTVAILVSFDTRFAFQIQQNNRSFEYSDHFRHVHHAIHRRQTPIDVISPTGDLASYRLVLAPALHVLTEAVAENLTRFVEAGGTLLVTPRTGVKDEANAVVDQRLPGLLADLCGIYVEEYDSLPAESRNQLEFALPRLAPGAPIYASTWCDVLEPDGATVIARYTQDHYAGRAAITLNQFGSGRVVYVGTFGDARLYDALADWLLEMADVPPLLAAPEDVEVSERRHKDRRLLFLLNHASEAKKVTLDSSYVDLLAEKTCKGTVSIGPKDVAVLLQENA
jgi:beta-galactosidase